MEEKRLMFKSKTKGQGAKVLQGMEDSCNPSLVPSTQLNAHPEDPKCSLASIDKINLSKEDPFGLTELLYPTRLLRCVRAFFL